MRTDRTVHTLGNGGEILDWLVSPAWSANCDDLADFLDADGSPWGDTGRWVLTNGPDVAPLKERLYQRHPLVTEQPLPEIVEGGPISWSAPVGPRTDSGKWKRFRTGPDGLVDWSEFCFTPQYRHAVAGAVLEVDQPEWRTLEVASTGPCALWAGCELLGVFTDVSYMDPVVHQVRARLRSGLTPLLLSTWQVAFREVRHVARLAVRGLPVRVVIPSPGADERVSAVAERVLDSVGLRAWALNGPEVELNGPPGAALAVSWSGGGAPQKIVLQETGARLPLLGASEEDSAQGTSASMLSTGEISLDVRVDDDRCPVVRRLKVAVLPELYRAEPEGAGPDVWAREVLEHVAQTPPSTARALARLALGQEGTVRPEDLGDALEMLRSRFDCADFQAVGLLNLWHQAPEGAWPEEQRAAVKTALLGFKYWIDQPGLDAMCYFTENHQMVFHTAETLAGETFSDETFTNTGWSGKEHASHGREMAVEWMKRKLRGGFSEFDSNAYMAIDSLALVSLVELGQDEEVRDMAEALLDKLFFTLAANSWKGIHGAAHGRSYAQTLRSSRFEETAPIMWALWGTGALNSAVLPVTCIARSRRYRLPPLVRSVATAAELPWWGRQVYRGQYRFTHDLLSRPYESDMRVWKTANAMLSSVQDYRPGLPGLQEHIWGATLSPEVQVYANYPANSSDSPSARPNAWAGQRVLPRARQDRDSLLVIYPGKAGTPLPSHVWFPAARMDETARRGPWLAGRVGDGYVAVACGGGLTPCTAGETAGQAWRPRGDGNAFVATVGSRGEDGSFEDFLGRLTDPSFGAGPTGAPEVRWSARDGRTLALGWDGPFLVNGKPDDLSADGGPDAGPHIANPACTVSFGDRLLEAAYGGHRLVIDLEAGRRLVPAHTEAVEAQDAQ